MKTFLCAAARALGCGDNSITDEEAANQSGERLKLPWAVYDDGARHLDLVYWWDTARDARHDISCGLITWRDGVTRCTPSDDALVRFTDASCTHPVGHSVAPATFFVDGEWRLDFDNGFARLIPDRVFRTSGTVIEVTGELFERRDGQCTLVVNDFRSTYELTEIVAADEWITLERAQLPSSRRLAHLVDRTSDGASIFAGFYDRELDVECNLAYAEDGVRCIPAGQPIEHFADAACTDRAVVVSGDAPRFATLATDQGMCSTVYAVGERIDRVFQRSQSG
jgi:hypothetical protein